MGFLGSRFFVALLHKQLDITSNIIRFTCATDGAMILRESLDIRDEVYGKQ
jgi:hypothetical protein